MVAGKPTDINPSLSALENIKNLIKLSLTDINIDNINISPVEPTGKPQKDSMIRLTNKEGQSELQKPVNFQYNRVALSNLSDEGLYSPNFSSASPENIKTEVCQMLNLVADEIEIQLAEETEEPTGIRNVVITPVSETSYLYTGTLNTFISSPPH